MTTLGAWLKGALSAVSEGCGTYLVLQVSRLQVIQKHRLKRRLLDEMRPALSRGCVVQWKIEAGCPVPMCDQHPGCPQGLTGRAGTNAIT